MEAMTRARHPCLLDGSTRASYRANQTIGIGCNDVLCAAHGKNRGEGPNVFRRGVLHDAQGVGVGVLASVQVVLFDVLHPGRDEAAHHPSTPIAVRIRSLQKAIRSV